MSNIILRREKIDLLASRKNTEESLWETICIFETVAVELLAQYINTYAAAAAPKSLQSCPTLCDPIDSSLPGSSVHGIFQVRVLEWGAIAFSNKHIYYVFNSRE